MTPQRNRETEVIDLTACWDSGSPATETNVAKKRKKRRIQDPPPPSSVVDLAEIAHEEDEVEILQVPVAIKPRESTPSSHKRLNDGNRLGSRPSSAVGPLKSDPNERPPLKSDPNECDRDLALRLQQEFNQELDREETDEELALRLYSEELIQQEDYNETSKADLELAKKLEQELHSESKLKEEKQMLSTMTGKACAFVERVLSLHRPNDKITPVAKDDLFVLAMNMLAAQAEFKDAGAPTHVSIGYHYTRETNMSRIQTDGLLTKGERDSAGINAGHNGSAFGDGVYTASNPLSTLGAYGHVGLIVARLHGNEDAVRNGRGNSVLVRANSFSEWVVLKRSCQCLALMQYDAKILYSQRSEGMELVKSCHCKLQGLIDEFFNGGTKTQINEAVAFGNPSSAGLAGMPPFSAGMPSIPGLPNVAGLPGVAVPGGQGAAFAAAHAAIQAHAAAQVAMFSNRAMKAKSLRRTRRVHFQANSTAPTGTVPTQVFVPTGTVPASSAPASSVPLPQGETVQYTAPDALANCDISTISHVLVAPTTTECSICLSTLNDGQKVVGLNSCKHEFHQRCLGFALKVSKACPICRARVGPVQGMMPSGTMRITYSASLRCGGHPPGTISIHYTINSGIQKAYHQHPGIPHGGATRIAYVPHTSEGRNLLKRLKYAFQHGLTFTVGTSLTTGQPNVVTWASIHHKTSIAGGPHGFPDPGFFANCNQELDSAGVPTADAL